MQNKTVLISGASIAGPTLAFWLNRYGYTVTIVERASALRQGGQAVDLRGAGRTVIERMGLMDAVRATELKQQGLSSVNAKGKVRSRMPVDAFGGEGIVSEIEILRGDLSQLLFDATKNDIEYLFNDTITALDQDADGVTATFENAAQRRFGLVIGADGLHSAVRRIGFGPEEQWVQPLGCYMAWFTAPAMPDLNDWYEMHQMPGGLVGSVRPGSRPTESKAGLSFRAKDLDYDRRDSARQREILAERFAGQGWRIPALLEAMHASADFSFDALGQVHMDHWTTGRLALVGDAGYCPSALTGLGTSLALVGGYILASELAGAVDHTSAFARYEELMRPYVTLAQELPPGGAKGYAPDNRLMIGIQALVTRSMTHWPMRPMMERMFAKADSIELPSYSPATQ